MLKRVLAALALMWASTAHAGPPYDTDDPIPTDTGYWEFYGFVGGEGLGRAFDGTAGIDLNYGPVPGVQLTATLPLDVAHDARTSFRAGDVEIGVKYRFFEKDHFALAAFPRVILPTGSSDKVGVLLPIWAQNDFGDWSLFGGGGYAVNPGAGNSSHWLGAVALTRTVTDRFSLGIEGIRSGSDSVGSRAVTTFGFGGIRKIGGPFAILASAGPTIEDGGGAWRYHAYLALGVNF